MDPSDRIGVLVSRQDEVLAHCNALLPQCRDPELQESGLREFRCLPVNGP